MLKVLKKLRQDIKIKFHKKIEIQKRDNKEIMTKMKNLLTQI